MKITSLIILFFLSNVQLIAQSDSLSDNLTRSRNRNTQQLLDYRFRGGTGAFEKIFFEHLSYTPEARQACVVGTVILSFTVDCNNVMGDFRMRNPLHHGLNEKLQEFYKATEGHWNSCEDEKYTRFEIPVLFTIEGTETAAQGFLVFEEEAKGLKCRSDAWFIEQYEKYKKKNRIKQALQALDVLIQRDPYNQQYYEMKRALLSKE
jgi:hypothetical protein